jgi:hypothetical protein
MPDDIEDFLRRAAQRRQAKPAQPKPPAPPPRPEYTDSRTERLPRNVVADDAPIRAVLIEEVAEPVSKHVKQLEKQRRQAEKATAVRRAGGTVKPVEPMSAAYVPADRAPSIAPQTSTGDDAGFTAADRLITMLQKPEGMLQAILLQEILTRPQHRW